MIQRMPIGLALALALTAAAGLVRAQTPVQPNPEYPDFYTGEKGASTKGIDFVIAIDVTSPAYCSSVTGEVPVVFKAPGMTQAKASCWQQPTADDTNAWGHDVVLADLKLDADGNGHFSFPADRFPNGPTTIRIHAKNDANKQDICELQLFNEGGVVWNQGIPRQPPRTSGRLWRRERETQGAPLDPPAAKGMKLLFADDFDGPLSISSDGKNARYPAHKTGGGDFSGWPFSDPKGENLPFGQRGTFLRIHASKQPGTKGCTGILSSLHGDGSGVLANAPCYFECRFVAQSAPGTWPAFWTLTKNTVGLVKDSPEYLAAKALGCEELDIIEAYGGYGPKNPNSGGRYHMVTHFWNMPKPAWYEPKGADGSTNALYKPHSAVADTLTLGGRSSWSWTFHTYGLLITKTDIVYYFDDIETLRHPAGPLSATQPAWFLINYAIGGISGWKIDLDRYGNQSDMWVDYVRVYQGD